MITTPQTPRPVALPVIEEHIPFTLRAERRWVVWPYVWDDTRWTKPPYQAVYPGFKADTPDPATWGTFDDAMASYVDGKADGIGFVLGSGYVGFDADHTGAAEYLQILHTYAERSPSGDGVHAICRGVKPGPQCRKGAYELYDHGRYLTVTGHHLPDMPRTVEERTPQVREVYGLLFPGGDPDEAPTSREGYALAPERSDEDLLMSAVASDKNGDAILALWGGDTSGYGSQSEADLALCCHLAFWTNYDADRVDRMFRQSKLMRDKWERESYRRVTIRRAFAQQPEVIIGGAISHE